VEHLQHFGLSQDPFRNESDLRFYFDSAAHREPERRIVRSLRQNKGLTILTGEGGSGKTLLSRRILESLEEEIFEPTLMVMLPGATNADDVLRRFGRQIGLEEPAVERAVLLAQVYERMAMIREEGRHAVLILDDAHLLAGDALAEIGGLLNLEYEDRRLLSLLLIGLPDLDVALSHDACLGQRVDVRVKIAPLTLQDTMAYLRHRISFVGGQEGIIEEGAIEALFKFGRGRPRLVNTLADNALFEAYLGGRAQMNALDVERAAKDLGIGLDPGSTFSAPIFATAGDSLEGGSADLDMGSAPDLAVPVAESAGAMSQDTEFANMLDTSAPDSSAGDLAGLLDDAGASGEDLTTIHIADSQDVLDPLDAVGAPESDILDLDAAVDVFIGEDPNGISLGEFDDAAECLPVFEAQNSEDAADAGTTRIAFADELPAGEDPVDDLDDLFVELIEE